MENKEKDSAYRLGDRYLSLHKKEEGTEYTILDEDFRVMARGMYEGEDISNETLLNMLVEELKKPGYDERSDLFFRSAIQKNIMQDDEPEEVDVGFLLDRSRELRNTPEKTPLEEAMDAIRAYKDKTAESYNPENMGGYSTDLIEETTAEQVRGIAEDYGIDLRVEDVMVFGSRSRGLEGKEDDLDIIVFYSGEEGEESIQELLNEEKRVLGGVSVDIKAFDINGKEKAGDYLLRAENFMSVRKSMMKEAPLNDQEKTKEDDPVIPAEKDPEGDSRDRKESVAKDMPLDPEMRESVLKRLKENQEIINRKKEETNDDRDSPEPNRGIPPSMNQ